MHLCKYLCDYHIPSNKSCEEYYTPELKQIVEESFKWEINKFNYELT